MPKEYIERGALIRELMTLPEQERIDIMGIYDSIRTLPNADVVEVVRCKDCKHQIKTWHEDKRRKEKGYYTFWCDLNEDPFVAHCVCGYDNDFCSYGERKDEE